MDVCVVGLGKLGLPLAVQIATQGHRVRGADINPKTVGLVNAGTEPFPGEAHLSELLAEVVGSGQLTAQTNTSEAVLKSQAVIVIVPLLVDANRQPDFGALDAATLAIGEALRPGTLVSYETTLPVGTTRQRFTPHLARLSGLTAGEDFYVVHSPERVFTGRVFSDLRRYPKLVGGINDKSASAGVSFYESVLTFDERPDLDRPNGVWAMANVETAELTKLAETTYRNVNIGLANEFAMYSESAGIDVYDVISAANSQVFSHIHQPGASVGGHCIPVYPHLYLLGDDQARLPRQSVAANESVPGHLVSRLENATPGGLTGKNVAVLGLAYRPSTKEDAFSGAYQLVRELESRDAVAFVDDPMYETSEIAERGLRPLLDRAAMDSIILHTAHPQYLELWHADFDQARVVLDGRHFLNPDQWSPATFLVLGRGQQAT